MTPRRSLLLTLCCLALSFLPLVDAQDDDPSFFTGTLIERTSQRIKVSRMRQGKVEEHEFRVTADTKFDRTVRVRGRVSVGYTSGNDGDIAVLVIDRGSDKDKKTAKEKN